MNATYQLDVRGLFEALGGPSQVAYVLGKMGLPVSDRTPEKWIGRGSVDALYLANLLAHEALENGPIDLNRFIIPAPPEGRLRPRARVAGRAASTRSQPKRGAEC